MKHYRITKYNPKYRNKAGHYIRDEWISFSDIGQVFNGEVFSLDEYLDIEEKYCTAVNLFMECCEADNLILTSVEYFNEKLSKLYPVSTKSIHKKVKNGNSYSRSEINDICKLILRENIWGKLSSSNMYVHFGYDYYMYIGVEADCIKTLMKIEEDGLFVEEVMSPYR